MDEHVDHLHIKGPVGRANWYEEIRPPLAEILPYGDPRRSDPQRPVLMRGGRHMRWCLWYQRFSAKSAILAKIADRYWLITRHTCPNGDHQPCIRDFVERLKTKPRSVAIGQSSDDSLIRRCAIWKWVDGKPVFAYPEVSLANRTTRQTQPPRAAPLPRDNLDAAVHAIYRRQDEVHYLFASKTGAARILNCSTATLKELIETDDVIDQPEGVWVPSLFDYLVRDTCSLGPPDYQPPPRSPPPQPPASNDKEVQSAMRALIAQARQATAAMVEAQQALIAAQQALVAVLPRAPTKREREKAALIALKELGLAD